MSGVEIGVTAPARLHLGILDLKGDLGRIYGSIGLAVKEPETIVKASLSNTFSVSGVNIERAREFTLKILKKLNLDTNIKVEVIKCAPTHVGLGSGTQLALSIGCALCKLFNLKISVEEIAKILGRGEVSGVGTYVFKYGGLVVDGGHKLDGSTEIPPLLFHYRVPDSWVFIIGIPNIERGFYGEEERRIMKMAVESYKQLPPTQTTRIVLMKLLPALIEEDIRSFGDAITKLEVEVGKMFSSVQKGVFRSPIIEKGVKLLLDHGAYGAGQSSWGPAFYGIFDEEEKAVNVGGILEEMLNKYVGGRVIVTKANNTGAIIKSLS